MLIGGTNETNANPDFELNVRKNTNVDFTGFTSSAFRFTRYTTTLVDILRNGNVGIGVTPTTTATDKLQVSGNITASAGTTANHVVIKSQLDTAARPYKVYTALLTQGGTNAPNAYVVLENTLGATITWTRNSVGVYYGTASSAVLTLNKTAFFCSKDQSNSLVGTSVSSTTLVVLTNQSTPTNTVVDGIVGIMVEIRVYN